MDNYEENKQQESLNEPNGTTQNQVEEIMQPQQHENDNLSSEQNNPIYIIITTVGIFLTLIGTLLMNSSRGLDGVIYMPFVYIIGPGLFISGLVMGLQNRHNISKLYNLTLFIIIPLISLSCVTAGYLIMKKEPKSPEYCNSKYPEPGPAQYGGRSPTTQRLYDKCVEG